MHTKAEAPLVVTVSESASLREAAAAMREENIGSLVVIDSEGNAVGMLTDRDLTLRAIAHLKDPNGTKVAEVMSKPLLSVEVDATLDAVASRMRSAGVRRMPVLRDGKPLGLYSLDDILSDLAGALRDVSDVTSAHLRAPEDSQVDDLMGEISTAMQHAREKMREASWRAQSAFLGELDDLRDRLRGALDSLRP